MSGRAASPRRSRPRSLSPTRTSSRKAVPAQTAPSEEPAIKSAPHEFGGVLGTTFLIFFLPAVILSLKIFCHREFCFERWDVAAILHSIPGNVDDYFSWEVTFVFACWIAYLALLERFLPAVVTEGLPLRDGRRLKYRLNGHLSFWVSILLADHFAQIFGVLSPSSSASSASVSPAHSLTLFWIYKHYLHLIVISSLAAFLLSVYLYWNSFAKGAMLAVGGNSGYLPYDFFLGRELNPRWGEFDIKLFVEMRVGLIGWVILDLAMLASQQQARGFVSAEMLMVVGCHIVYVWDSLYSESAVLSTMDFTTDGLGFMLTFGDMVWMPFGFSVQTRYLVDHDPNLPAWALVLIGGLMVFGYWLFRSANSQKDLFRTNPNDPAVSHLESLPTERGTRLLISGFWGLARKINYTGDLIMALSWCLPCGFSHPIPYFYFFYLLFLLIHRARRDDEACHKKYGQDWEKYKKHVPYVFIPWVI